MTTQERNKAIVRRLWEEVWNQNHLDVCDEIFDAAYAEHERGYAPYLRNAFPDLQFAIDEMLAEGDRVVSRITLTGTHRGEFMGVAATGKSVRVEGIWIHQVTAGRIVYGPQWGLVDRWGMMEQVGVLPKTE